MSSAQEYPISFPYGGQDGEFYGPNGSVGLFHKGDDRACPEGTPVLVGGLLIGLTGHSGVTGGSHLHIQEWQSSVANTRKPQNAFKGGGMVVNTGTASQWGNFVSVKYDDGWITTYCHLSEIKAAIGQKLEETQDMITDKDGDLLRIIDSEIKLWDFNEVHSGKNDASELAAWVGKDFRQIISEGWVEAEQRRIERQQALEFYRNDRPKLEAKVKELTTALEIHQAANGDATRWQTLKALIKNLIS